MMLQAVFLFVSLLLGVVRCQVVDLTMQRALDNIYCGHLRCVANISLTVINMAIYDVTEKGHPLKLASISVFAPEVIVDPSTVHTINVTGSISENGGVLDVRFLRDVDCLYGAFRCDLDFININGHPDVISKNMAPAAEENATILFNLAKIATQLTEHSEETNKQLEALKQDNEILKKVLDNVLLTVSRIDASLNSTCDKEQEQETQPGSSCYRGMPHNSPREKFILPGKGLALCDTETDGGGWVIIQRRVRGDVDFYRSWDDYKKGFGTPDTDFWIGNEIIHNLTSQGYNQLRIDLVSNNIEYFAEYSNFVLADESSAYAITVGGFSGNVYDGMSFSNGSKFGTFDRDNDMDVGNCAVHYHSGWWFKDCSLSNLNGAWGVNGGAGLFWDFPLRQYPSFTEMKLRYIEK